MTRTLQPLVIDAQLIKAFFQEDQQRGTPECTASMATVIQKLGSTSAAFVDGEGKIEHEWRSLVEPEWFVAWYAGALDSGAVELIDIDRKHELVKALEAKWGFPKDSCDSWYIFTSCAVVRDLHCRAVLLSEDLDFYEPSEKRCDSKRRRALLTQQKGQVARYLRRKAQIDVRPVVVHIQVAGSSVPPAGAQRP